MERIAIYPGSFDPVTNGHLDIVERGLKLFDKVIVAILQNPKKQFLFPLEERLEMLKISMQDFPNVEADAFAGLLVDYAERRGAAAVLRGLRALSDFEFEFQMALMNRRLNREIQTVFLMTGMRWIYTSSSIFKEAAQFGGDIEGMVPPVVLARLKEKFPLLAQSPEKREAFAGVQRHWQQASTRCSLAGLDDATLRDLGITRAEIGSVAAEVHEAVVCTRVRTVGHCTPEGWS